MQPSSLLDNLNADLLAAISALSPKGTAQRVLVYVESHDDIAFWRGILSPFEKNGLDFDIQLPAQHTLEKGKTTVLEFADRVGRNLILCLDSDYDYLLQGHTDTSALINENPYIFQTYTYSIENLKCYSEGLHLICTQSSKNDAKIIDFNELMQVYSAIVYELFLWSVHFSLKQDTTSFTLTEFCDTIKLLDSIEISDKFTSALQRLRERVDTKRSELAKKHPKELPEIKILANKLEQLGVLPTNTYLFIQGHTLQDNVVLMVLKPIFLQLKAQKEKEIKDKAKHNEELVNQLNFYKSQTIPVNLALDNNTAFKNCFLYLKLEADIRNYVEQFQKNT